jgi:Tol biopolymer transport system component
MRHDIWIPQEDYNLRQHDPTRIRIEISEQKTRLATGGLHMKRNVVALAGLVLLTCAHLLAQRGAPQRQVMVFDRQGMKIKTLAEPGLQSPLVISPDGKRVAAIRNGTIVIMDIATGAAVKATSGPGDTQPAFSADGSRIVFQSSRSGTGVGFYQTLSDGTGKEELVFGPVVGPNGTGWSTDGKYVTYQGTDPSTGTSTDLFILPMMGDKKPIPLLRTKAVELGARISPDGRYYAYRSDESGMNEVYVRPFNPGGNPEPQPTDPKWRVSQEGSGGMVRWRQDGKELYFLASNGSIMAVPVSTGATFAMTTAPIALFSTPLEFPLGGTPGASADVSADGKTFVLLVPVTQP